MVAVAWVKSRGANVIPIVGARKLSQIQDSVGSVAVELSADHLARLDAKSRVPLGFPHDFGVRVRNIVYGDLHEKMDLPDAARPRGGGD